MVVPNSDSRIMKTIFTFFALLGFTLNLFGQGALMRPFGSSYTEVLSFLEKQKLGRMNKTDQETLTVTTDEYEVQHLFRENRLYKTEVVRYYHDRKGIQDAMSSLRQNYQVLGGDVMDLNTAKDQAVYAVRLKGELHEISQVKLGKKGFQLIQVKLDLEACSHEEMKVLKQDELLTVLLKE